MNNQTMTLEEYIAAVEAKAENRATPEEKRVALPRWMERGMSVDRAADYIRQPTEYEYEITLQTMENQRHVNRDIVRDEYERAYKGKLPPARYPMSVIRLNVATSTTLGYGLKQCAWWRT